MRKAAFNQRKVWFWMRKQAGPVSREQIAKRYEISPNAASLLLQRMKRRGFVRKAHGNTWGCLWAPVGDVAPTNDSGISAGSLKALLEGQRKWQESMAKAQAALGREWSPENQNPKRRRHAEPKPKPATALEAAWGWLPKDNAEVRHTSN